MLKRMFDFLMALCLGVILLLPILTIALSIWLTSPGPILHWSYRVGHHNRIFKMPKFRSMRIDTPTLATHLLSNPDNYLTPIGSFLRKTSLDELPQLFSILKGNMSFVGPRPVLYNPSEKDLITLRTEHGVHTLLPGLTGWAQINGRAHLSALEKVKLDAEYLRRRSFWFDLYIVWQTIWKVLSREGIIH